MSEVTQEEKCRVIAEWLGWTRRKTATSHYWNTADGTPVGYDGSFNFYGDEAANALILEKMPMPELWVESMPGESKLWSCVPDIMQEGPDKNAHYIMTADADRKKCIADAGYALALREREGRK